MGKRSQERTIARNQEETRRSEIQRRSSETDAQKRRDESRSHCELTYSFYAPKLGERFTRAMLDSYIEKYMGDNQTPEDVERRGQELQVTLQKHLESVEPPKKKLTLESLARWFIEEKQRIESLPVDEKSKRRHIAELNGRYAELSSQLMENIQP
jgi:hypothetical protein